MLVDDTVRQILIHASCHHVFLSQISNELQSFTILNFFSNNPNEEESETDLKCTEYLDVKLSKSNHLQINDDEIPCTYYKYNGFIYKNFFLSTSSRQLGVLTLAFSGSDEVFDHCDDQFQILLDLLSTAMIRMERSAILEGLTTAWPAEDGVSSIERITSLVQRTLDADLVLVGETDADKDEVRVLSIIDRDGWRKPDAYPLAGSPCADVVPDRCHICRSAVAEKYPLDTMLGDEGIESYAGIGLKDGDDNQIGLLVAMFHSPIIFRHRIEDVLPTFADRASAEILRQRTEKSFVESQQHLKRIIDEIPDGLVVLDDQGRITFCNPAATAIFNASPSALAGARLSDRLGILATDIPDAEVPAVEADRKPSAFAERIVFSPYLNKWLSLRGYINRTDRTLFVRDISAYAQREKRYQELATLNRRFMECSPDIIVTFNRDRRLVFVSERCRDVLGYEPAEMIGCHTWEFIHPEDQARTTDIFTDIRSQNGSNAIENRYVRKDGTAVPILWAAVWSDEDDMGFAVGRDMSPWRQMEHRVREAQRVEALGRLTGGISHDFNNLLAVVLGNAEMLAEALEGQKTLQRMAELILSAASRGHEMNERLLTFARQKTLSPAKVDLPSLLTRFEPLIRQAVGPQVRLTIHCAPGLSPLTTDVSQLEAALLNLAINARDAMPRGGVLAIRAKMTSVLEEAPIDSGLLTPGLYVRVSVSDSGFGMSTEVKQRAFDPFFSTKEVGKGSGLGLSTIHGFMNQSGGGISIESTPGIGTIVTLFFPAKPMPQPAAIDDHDETMTDAEKPSLLDATQPASSVAAPPATPDDHEALVVLVVEDDSMVLDYVSNLLTGHGCRVISAETANKGLKIVESNPAIDLVLSDIVMPDGMDGISLAGHIRTLFPALPVLLTTGFHEKMAGLTEAGLTDIDIIRKPYRPADLLAKVKATAGHARRSSPPKL